MTNREESGRESCDMVTLQYLFLCFLFNKEANIPQVNCDWKGALDQLFILFLRPLNSRLHILQVFLA